MSATEAKGVTARRSVSAYRSTRAVKVFPRRRYYVGDIDADSTAHMSSPLRRVYFVVIVVTVVVVVAQTDTVNLIPVSPCLTCLFVLLPHLLTLSTHHSRHP